MIFNSRVLPPRVKYHGVPRVLIVRVEVGTIRDRAAGARGLEDQVAHDRWRLVGATGRDHVGVGDELAGMTVARRVGLEGLVALRPGVHRGQVERELVVEKHLEPSIARRDAERARELGIGVLLGQRGELAVAVQAGGRAAAEQGDGGVGARQDRSRPR